MHPGRVQPFSLEGLPRLPRTAARSTRALALAGLPAQISAGLRRIGEVRVRVARIDFVPGEEGGCAFALEVRGQPARLTVEPLLALRLVSAVLGLPAPLALRPLGRSERGVLAAAIATWLEAAGADASVRVALDDAGPLDSDALAVGLLVESPAGKGRARLDLPPSALPPAGPRPLDLDARRLAPALTVELARTTLTGAALTSAEPGDTLVFEARALPPDQDWAVKVRLGACGFSAKLDPGGELRRQGPLEDHESETPMSAEDTTAPVPTASLSADAARTLAAAPVEIVAELGRLTVRGDELAGLVDGGVLALGPRRPAQVVLRVAGRVWAHGELVAIDDELGVRITALVK